MSISEENIESIESIDVTFKSLGLADVICEACERLNWKHPTHIQEKVVPVALEGRDVIALAQTGSGKTGAFVLPIVQALLKKPKKLFALVLTPTRELAEQTCELFQEIGSSVNIKCTIIIGGENKVNQCISIAKGPNVVIATPGRLLDILENVKGIDLDPLKYLVIDETDKMLNMDFEKDILDILKLIPKKRVTYLFSATINKKVKELQKISLKDPVNIDLSADYRVPSTLSQHFLLIPFRHKELHLVHLLKEMSGDSIIIFCRLCSTVDVFAVMLKILGFSAIPLHGQMLQDERRKHLDKFKNKPNSILVATNVASRGLDITHVDCVINYDLSYCPKEYVHKVGRTARAGRPGKAFTLVTEFDVYEILRVENLLGYKIPMYEADKAEVMKLENDVDEAGTSARRRIKQLKKDGKFYLKRKRTDGNDNDDSEETLGVRKRFCKERNADS